MLLVVHRKFRMHLAKTKIDSLKNIYKYFYKCIIFNLFKFNIVKLFLPIISTFFEAVLKIQLVAFLVHIWQPLLPLFTLWHKAESPIFG